MANIVAVCTSKTKGMRKKTVSEATAKKDVGFLGDAHADPCTHRQVSLLAVESIEKMRGFGFHVG